MRNTLEEMARNRDEKPDAVRGVAAKIENYNDVESFEAHARQAASKELKHLTVRPDVTWKDVHALLASKGLQLEKAEQGGYTVRSTARDSRQGVRCVS